MLSTGSYPQANDMQMLCPKIVDKSVDKVADSTIAYRSISVWRVTHNASQNAPQEPTEAYKQITHNVK
jgi:hypothetical protein